MRIRSKASASSTVARRTPMSGVRVEPVGDPARVLDAVFRFPTAREVVVVFGEPDEDRFLAEHLQRGEELLRLLDRTAEVALGVKDEERRFHVGDIRERRAEDELLAVAPRRRIPHLVLPEMPADVARAERGDVVRDAPLRDGGTKAIVVSNDPVRHETAVAAAGHVEALRVDPAETKRVIDAGHEVFVIFPAPIADARFDEPLTVRVAPTWVREKHRVAAPREHLELVKEGVPVSGVRPAVDLENERPLLRRIEAERFHEPALDRPPLRAGELDPLRCR